MFTKYKILLAILILTISLAAPTSALAAEETPPPVGLINYATKFVPVAGDNTAQVCFPVPDEGTRNLAIRYWSVDSGKWVAIETTITNGMICGTAATPGIYAMQGPQALGLKDPRIAACKMEGGNWDPDFEGPDGRRGTCWFLG